MPQTKVVFYRETDGTVPLLDWLDALPRPAVVKCRVKLDRLKELGHELRRPEADFLRDGVSELRIRLQRINYRLLYFFHGKTAARGFPWDCQREGSSFQRNRPGRQPEASICK